MEIQEKMEKIDEEILLSMEKWEDIENELKNLKKAL